MNPQQTVKEILETGITQAALAEMVGCSQSLVSALFTGERGNRISFLIGSKLADVHKNVSAISVANIPEKARK